MNDAKMLLWTETRLTNLDRSKGLLELSVTKIVNNVRFFLKNGDGKERLRSLPPCLREKLLGKLTNQKFLDMREEIQEFDARIEAFKLLLCPGIKVINLQGSFSFQSHHPYPLNKTLKVIAQRAPNLRSLTIGSNHDENDAYLESMYEDRVSLSQIGELRKLQRLVIKSNWVEYTVLKNACREQLRSLDHLDVNVIFDCDPHLTDVQDFKQSFGHLRVLLFNVCNIGGQLSDEECGEMLHCMSVQHLPGLLVAQKLISINEMQIDSCPCSLDIPLEVSSLRHLRAVPGAVGLHKAFPRVTHLEVHLCCGESDLDSMLHFKNIKSLTLLAVSSAQTVERFLVKYGRGLETLMVVAQEATSVQLEFKSLLFYCRKLKKLSLMNVDVRDDAEPLHFPELEDFHWFPNCERSVCLSSIVQAPKLETIMLQLESFDANDLNKVTSMISKKNVLRELRSLKFYNINSFDLGPFFMAKFRAASEMLKNASVFLPKLTDIVLDLAVDLGGGDVSGEQRNFEHGLVGMHNRHAYSVLEDPNLVHFLSAFRRRNFV